MRCRTQDTHMTWSPPPALPTANLTGIDRTTSDRQAISLDIDIPTPHVNVTSINLPSLSSALAATVSASATISTASPTALDN
ncbi:hypothetical protein EYF80_050746 [Liparis tanakae]|uniref:Uncharacterized protein n=1 Tax=Liparis tanakae TaxID=230148 RepID=A0A4Z2FD11_9TELE|nr:hypothetical protein EYF80_050746 [Liparis tanakae]